MKASKQMLQDKFRELTLQGIAAMFVSFFTPIVPLVIGVGALIFINTIMGVYAAIRNKEFDPRKLWSTIEKFVFSALAIIATHILETIWPEVGFLKATAWVSAFIAIYFLVSIYHIVKQRLGIDLVKYMQNQFKIFSQFKPEKNEDHS